MIFCQMPERTMRLCERPTKVLRECARDPCPRHRHHKYLVSQVGFRGLPVVLGGQPLLHCRVVDADLVTSTQRILLGPDLVGTDQVGDQPPGHISHLQKRSKNFRSVDPLGFPSASIFTMKGQTQRAQPGWSSHTMASTHQRTQKT